MCGKGITIVLKLPSDICCLHPLVLEQLHVHVFHLSDVMASQLLFVYHCILVTFVLLVCIMHVLPIIAIDC